MNPQPEVVFAGEIEPGVSVRVFADRVLHVAFAAGLPTVDRATVRRWRDGIAEIIDGPYVAVGDLRNLGFIDQEARTEFAGDHEGRVLASAPTVGRGQVMPFLVDLWKTKNEIKRPVQVFEEVAEALAWAHETAARLRSEGRLPATGPLHGSS